LKGITKKNYLVLEFSNIPFVNNGANIQSVFLSANFFIEIS